MLDAKVRLYYRLKKLIPHRVRTEFKRQLVRWRSRSCGDTWPIHEAAGSSPANWSGWPEGKRFVLVLTHDVETLSGHDRCLQLAGLEQGMGFRSAFYFVAGDYPVSAELRDELVRRGFEIGVHGLTHDGSLYRSKKEFLRQARLINQALKEWQAAGFRSPCMHHNLDWLHHLDIEYDASTFDTDPFEPQPDGLHTIFPLHVANSGQGKGYVELPYTLPQDSTLFLLMREKTIDLWKKKLDWIASRGGVALVITHPDYMRFGKTKASFGNYSVDLYAELLEYVKTTFGGDYWHVLPRDLVRFWANSAVGAKPR